MSKRGAKRDGRYSPKRRLFALEYLVDFNATAAAKRAGYSERSAYAQGHDLLKDPEVQQVIEESLKAREERLAEQGDSVLTELERIAYTDLAEAFEDDGVKLKNIREIPLAIRRAISSFEVVEYFEQVEDGEGKPRREQVGWIRKVKLAGKVEALNLLGKARKLWSPEDGEGGGAPAVFQLVVNGVRAERRRG